MMKQLFYLFLGAMLMVSCVEETNPEFDQKSFTKIYDNNLFTINYFPIDMVQTEDGGYLILGGRRLETPSFIGIYLMKADKDGNFVSDVEVDESFTNPVARLALINNTYRFFCMDPLTYQVHLAQTDANLEAVNIEPVNGAFNYPCAAQADGNSFILLSYDDLDKQSVLTVLNANGNVTQSRAFTIGAGEDVDGPILRHFMRIGRQYPFEVGRIPGGLYYFNGFYNYTFSLVFTNLNQDGPNGVVNGNQEEGGLSAVQPLSATKFAVARFSFDDNYLVPNTTLNPTGISSSVNLGGNTLPELEPNARIKILRTSINNKNVLVYGSNTRSKQIGLYFYDEATGTFITSKYLGFSNPFEIAQVISTEDGGLAVCGTTYVAGRFPRICLIKLHPDDLSKVK
ncbi:MAG: hypothetical protein KF803_08335 [Cyclobacteriaceae bacterium]|nr:hypothetical protein [Cyclobacteriaceae bacterium]